MLVRYREVMQALRAGDVGAADFHEVVVGALQRIIADNGGGRVVVFCHAGVINFWAAHVIGSSHSMFFYPHYTSVNRFKASRSGDVSVHSLNELGHLR
jgi:probable phosphoglycerate mutase